MKKQIFIFAFALGSLLAGCTSENVSNVENNAENISHESLNGFSQKGPILAGASVVVQELDSATLLQTGKSFRGKVVSDNGEFVVENVNLNSPYVLLEVNGYFRNEVTGKNSDGAIFMKALADVGEQKNVNINLLTHLEYERVQVLLEQKKISFDEAKRIADSEIFASFYADGNFGKVENLNIFGDSDGDAALLAFNILLLETGSEATFMENFAKLGTDLAEDGVWDDSLFKVRIADGACDMDYDGKLSNIRKNIESWKIANNVASFERYVSSFWENVYGLGKCDASNLGKRMKNSNASSTYYGVEFTCNDSKRWSANLDSVRAGCDSCGFMIDPRDGRKYRTVRMAGTNWMAENLAYNGYGEGSLYYGDESYGLLYTITSGFPGMVKMPGPDDGKWTYNHETDGRGFPVSYLHTGCPDGWRLPTREEFARLVNETSENDYEQLLSPKGWNLQPGFKDEMIVYFSSTLDSVTPYGEVTRYSYARMNVYGSRGSLVVNVSGGMGGRGFIRCVEDGSTQEFAVLPPSEVVADSFVDERDGRMYKTLKFENQLWMAQNVTYAIGDSLLENGAYRYWGIFETDLATMMYSHQDIGWRYNWQEMREACPEGWRIPSSDDAKKLLKHVGGGLGNAAFFTTELKGSQDIYGFAALPSEYERGWCTKAVNGCSYAAVGVKFWISDSASDAAKVLSFDQRDAKILSADTTDYLPVRCVKDAEN